MAIGTAERRRGVAHIARMWSGVGLTPLAAEDMQWRHEVARKYPGIMSGVSYLPIAGAMNESIRAYLNNQYDSANPDIEPLLDYFLDNDTLTDKAVSLRALKVATDVEN